jgi:predicted site-specific integrase-resolvase
MNATTDTLDTNTVLEVLGISRPVLERLIRNGDLEPVNRPVNGLVQRARRWYFPLADVERIRTQPPPRRPRTVK